MNQNFQAAVAALQQGDLDKAGELAASMLAQSEHPQVQHLLGVIRFQQGDEKSGRELLDAAVKGAPQDPEIEFNYGTALVNAGALQEAVEHFETCLSIQADHLPALNSLGSAWIGLGEHNQARDVLIKATRIAPGYARAHYNLATSYLQTGDDEQAEASLNRALANQPDHIPSAVEIARLQIARGQAGHAAQMLKPLLAIGQEQPELHAVYGAALNALLQFDDAVAHYEQAIALHPENPDHWNNLSNPLLAMQRATDAQHALRRALELDPDHQLAKLNLATALELNNQVDEAQSVAEELIASDDDLADAARIIMARICARSKDHQAALGHIGKINLAALNEEQQRDYYFVQGKCLDIAGEYEAAFESFSKGNDSARERYERGLPSGARQQELLVDKTEALLQSFDKQWWESTPSAEHTYASPMVLCGFQRSGTTLLDTLLGGHSQIAVLEERPMLDAVVAQMEAANIEYPSGVSHMMKSAWYQAARTYWQEAKLYMQGQDQTAEQLLLDKSPLHTSHLPFILKLFPQAKAIVMLRHPADVVLSNFMQDFTVTDAMVAYTRMDSIAKAYAATMSAWLQYREFLGDQAMQIRYEDLVEQPESELKGLLAYLGLAWEEGLADSTTSAKARGFIATPSYADVAEPIYKRASGRWRNYVQYLEPVWPTLEPYIAEFGYET